MDLARLDHLVLATPDLDATSAWLERALGVSPSLGGRHDGRGTRNRLLALGPGHYLEVIGPDPDQPEPPRPRPFAIDRLEGPALTAWAARSSSLEEDAVTAARLGFDLGAVEAMGRTTPDGVTLRWRLTLRSYDHVSVVPFLIDWGATAHPSATAARGVTLVALRGLHPDAGRVTRLLDALGLDLPVEVGREERLVAEVSGPAGGLTLGDARL